MTIMYDILCTGHQTGNAKQETKSMKALWMKEEFQCLFNREEIRTKVATHYEFPHAVNDTYNNVVTSTSEYHAFLWLFKISMKNL